MYSDDESQRKTTKFRMKASFLTPKTMKKTTVPQKIEFAPHRKVEFEVIWRELEITLLIIDKLSDKIRSSKICGCHFTGNFFF